jgi:hypothetical protein
MKLFNDSKKSGKDDGDNELPWAARSRLRWAWTFVLALPFSYLLVHSGFLNFVRSLAYNNIRTIDTHDTVILPTTDEFEFEIPIHKSSSYVKSDVSKIIHVPAELRIEVHLKAKSIRRCQNPFFKGRISGWSLSMIHFDSNTNSNNDTDVVVGTYDLSQIPMSGRYYVEILVLLCEGYGENFRDVNLAGVCLETVEDANHRITEENGMASIDIDIDVDRASLRHQQHQHQQQRQLQNAMTTTTSRGIGGRWLHKKFLAKQQAQIKKHQQRQQPNRADAIVPPKPLFTRSEGMELPPFTDYTFRWNKGPNEVLNQPGLVGLLLAHDDDDDDDDGGGGGEGNKNTTNNNKTSSQTPPYTQVCFLGASHSRELTNHCHRLLNQTREEMEAHRNNISKRQW